MGKTISGRWQLAKAPHLRDSGLEPSGTSTTGDRHDGAIPDHVDSTAGHQLREARALVDCLRDIMSPTAYP